jgi:hypothetical protein
MACYCTILPIAANCLRECAYKAVSNLSVTEKVMILGLDPTLSATIFQVFRDNDVRSFEQLSLHLAPSDIDQLLRKYQSINQVQLDYINLPQNSRRPVVDEIERLGLANL